MPTSPTPQLCWRRLPAAVVIGDKGYDKQEFVEAIEANGGEAVIPSRKNRTVQRDVDTDRYKDRPAWSSGSGPRPSSTAALPHATRRPARNFLAFVHVASIMILLR